MMAMPICPACGSESEPSARFCPSCGTPLAGEAQAGSETRKTVTVLFSDVGGFTDLGEELDPEAVRQLMNRYFQQVKDAVERHGGTTEKFIGDAVVAVFGVPRLHEDDAHRAVRAAVEARQALESLNDEFEQTWGVRLATRMGVNTGEVIAGDPEPGQAFVAGDAVNVAARLEQAAQPGEILIGDTTYRLVKDAITAEPLAPLSLKGKTDLVAAWRLVDVSLFAAPWTRRLDSPLVGRESELGLLQDTFERMVERRECQLVTVMGPAGAGKSRLANELADRAGSRAKIVGGRCLSYGEGITYWPITELLRGAAGIGEFDAPGEASSKILELLGDTPDSALIGERLAGFLGLSDVTPGVPETFWAVRKLLEALAARQPLIAVFEDIHWAEPTFLDLLEYLVEWMRGVPVMLLCLARPELLEVRGSWMTGKPNASAISLPPLTETEMAGLIENLLGGGRLAEDARLRIADAAEGNPLFVEETLRMLVDDGLLARANGSWVVTGDLSTLTIPATIQALLTARLDRLDDEERAVLERASVIGRAFWWGAVVAMSPEEERSRVGAHLQALMRKQLISPDRSDFSEEDAFRFTHVLGVEAAYRRIPKATRADLHERFAAWVEGKGGTLAEYEEIVGFHLEQAHRSLAELGQTDDRVHSLARRAAAALGLAGRRAFARGDMPAAVNLIDRATMLTGPDDPERMTLLPDLAFALLETGDFERMQEVVAETSEAASASSDRRLQAQALILGLWVRLFTDPEGWAAEAEREATRAIAIFEDEEDERGLAKAWSVLGLFHLTTCEFAAAEEAWEKAAAHADAAGAEREKFEALSWVPLALWAGPTPVEESLRRCEDLLRRSAGDRKAMSTVLASWGGLEAMDGRFSEARSLSGRARATLEEVALPVWLAGPVTQLIGWEELLAGDPAAAEQQLRWGLETLREIGEQAWLSTVAAILAEALRAQGRYDEAEEFLRMGEETAGSEDAYSQSLLRSVSAKILALRGQVDEAERLGREAVGISEETDFLFLQWFALASLAEVLRTAGRVEQAEAVVADALRVCDLKGFQVGAQAARAVLERPVAERTS
jgi:class 3 adenylate cyclase/tetratricopeptide (TPR) repeat protein